MRKTTKSHVSIVLFREEEKWRIASNLWSRQSPIFLGCSRCSNSSARQSHGGEQVKVIVHRESDGGGGVDGEFSPQIFFSWIFLPRSSVWTPGKG